MPCGIRRKVIYGRLVNEVGVSFKEASGEAAYYGPKIDVQLNDVLGHSETLSTVQLDFYLPERFELEYVDRDGQYKRPVMIHRGVISTMERMMAFLIEHYAGNFPLWLAPVQAQDGDSDRPAIRLCAKSFGGIEGSRLARRVGRAQRKARLQNSRSPIGEDSLRGRDWRQRSRSANHSATPQGR